MLLLPGFQDDGNQLNIAVPNLVRHLVCGVTAVTPSHPPGLLCLHVVLQLPVGGVYLLQQLSPAHMHTESLFCYTLSS